MMLSVRCFSISVIEHNLAWRVVWLWEQYKRHNVHDTAY